MSPTQCDLPRWGNESAASSRDSCHREVVCAPTPLGLGRLCGCSTSLGLGFKRTDSLFFLPPEPWTIMEELPPPLCGGPEGAQRRGDQPSPPCQPFALRCQDMQIKSSWVPQTVPATSGYHHRPQLTAHGKNNRLAEHCPKLLS